MRPCQTCQCFVPFAVDHCPRCGAALEPIEAADDSERRLALVGSGSQSQSDAVARSVLAQAVLPAIDRPAGRPPRPSLPELPKPVAPEPLVAAVAVVEPVAEAVEPVAEVAEPVVEEEAPEEEAPDLVADSFSALLAAPAEDLLPSKPAPPPPSRPPVHSLVTVPVAASSPRTEPLPVPKSQRRFARRDPFTRGRTRREKTLTRLCLLLVIALGAAVLVLRLPLGPRPKLGATAKGDGVSSSVSIPVPTLDDSMQLQTRSDLRGTLVATEQLYPVFKSYAVATPAVLKRSLPQLNFVPSVSVSRLIGEISVAASAYGVVLAEYAGPGQCAFARIVGRQPAQTTMGPNGGPCRASAAPPNGWNPLSTD